MTEEQKNIITDEIKLQRFKNKIRCKDISKALGISRETYRRLENNPNIITFNQGLIISEVLNWNFYDFILSEVLHTAISKKGE